MTEEKLPEYSVLMSVYAKDKPEYLSAAISSMVEQTVPFRDMVIVCDGPLTEGLDTVLGNWKQDLGGRLILHRLSENGGLGPALAEGLGQCRCDVVARMDADDISRPDRCRILLEKMVADGLDLVGGAIEEFDHEPGDMGSVRTVPLEKKDIDAWLKRRNPFNHMSVMFDKRVVEKAGGYQPFLWMEDYWLWVRMIVKGCRCANVPNVVVDVRAGDGMYARRSNIAYLKSQIRFFSKLRGLGVINRLEQVKAILERTAATVLPAEMVKAAYNKLLRRHA